MVFFFYCQIVTINKKIKNCPKWSKVAKKMPFICKKNAPDLSLILGIVGCLLLLYIRDGHPEMIENGQKFQKVQELSKFVKHGQTR